MNDESLQLQEQLLRSLLGMFCGRVAHDLGNPLAASKGFAQLIEMADASPKVKEMAGEIVKAATKIQDIIEQLRGFSRRIVSVDSSQLDINDSIRKVAELLGPQLAAMNVRLELSLTPDLGPIWAGTYQIESVFYHLITYCRDAFVSRGVKGERRIQISTAKGPNGETLAELTHNAGAMTDQGGDSVFKAFIASKDAAQLSGVGIPLMRSILEKLRAKVEVVSAQGDSTTFAFTFPLDRRNRAPSDRTPRPPQPVTTSKPSLLVVDDEPSVGEMLALAVKEAFETTVISEPKKAMAEIAARKYDLIVTDLRMPGVTGLAILARAKECQRETPVVVVSGQLESDKELQHAIAQGASVIEKPYESPDQVTRTLLARVRR